MTDDKQPVPRPTTADYLVPVLRRALNDRRYPRMIPGPNKADWRPAVNFWVNHQEPMRKPGEFSHQIRDGVWHCPYLNRIKHALEVFLGFEHIQQLYVIEGIHQHLIAYRGDPFALYREICEESMRYRQSISAMVIPDDDTDERRDRVIQYMDSRMPREIFRDLPYRRDKWLTG